MLQSDARPLRRWLDGVAGPPRYFRGAHESVAFTDLITGSSLGGRCGAFQGRSVLVATREQLTAALAMIELDGIARRLVICPPDVPRDHLRAIVATAEIDAVVSDSGTPDSEALGVPLHARCAAIEPQQDLPAGGRQTEWVLLTSVPTQTVEQAWERVDWYRARWIVEDYHQGLKTGCRVEQRQVQTYEGLRRLLGLLAPAAVRLLQLRATARQTPEQPASQTLPAEVVQVVAARAGVPASQLTAQQCWHSIARFGGYLGRKGDGPPGWKTLWRGWLYIQTLLEGVHLAAQLSLDSSSDP